MVSALLFKHMLTPLDYSIVKFTTFADTSAVAQVRDLAESVHFEKGAVIESRGKPTDHIYLIDEGLVQLGITGVDGSQSQKLCTCATTNRYLDVELIRNN